MGRLVIGLDIDGVIVDYATAMLPLLSEICGRPISYQDLGSRDLGEALNIDGRTVTDVWERVLISNLLRNAQPINGAIVGLSALSQHEIWLVTGRPASMRYLTELWFQKKNVKYDYLLFDRIENKLAVGQGFDVFVEDYLEEACAIAEAGVFSILFDQPWNQAPALPEKCVRVYDWNGVLQAIDKLASQREVKSL
jgi:uncharacterized HAD superfamily protein